MQTEKTKGNDDTRTSLLREILSWVVSACSILWLIYLWNVYVRTPNDQQIFIIAVLIYIPVWIVYVRVKNHGERHKRLSDIIAIIAIYPPVIMYAWLYFSSRKSAIHDSVELIMLTVFFGLFWELGRKVKEFRIVLFRD